MDSGQTLVSLQYLRAIAALLVVVHHVMNARAGFASSPATADLGRMGVMIFFVLSGFIILHSSRHARSGQFLLRRVIRVVPLYWLLTLVYFGIQFRNDLGSDDVWRRVPSLLASLFFVPYPHLAMTDKIWPVLVQGWTLNFEMFFYALFAVGLMLGRPGVFAAVVVVSLVGLGLVMPTTSPVMQTWTDPLMLLFVAGLVIAEMRAKRSLAGMVWVLPMSAVLAAACAFGWAGGSAQPVAYFAAIGMVVGCVALADRAPSWRVPLLGPLGDASYAIYLSHTIFLIALLPMLRQLPLSGWLQVAVVSLLAACLATALGVLVHYFVERPLTRFLRHRFDRPSSPQSVSREVPN